ncbi:MAG TPA: ABC transporter permease [Candidatus Acidoferrum sp.]|nr:ABC transporter permease [Candidatus Acidoferrum sp.]
MDVFSSQFKQVFRRLRRAPMFTAITLVTLAAAIGANTVVFSVVEGVVLKPLAYPKSEELVGIWLTAPGVSIKNLQLSPADYFVYRDQNQTFQDIGVYSDDMDSVTGIGEPEQVQALNVTDGLLPLLGVRPTLGRMISRADDTGDAPPTVMLSYGYWQRKFGGSQAVVGKTIVVDGKQREIIGVLPRGFRFLDETRDAALIVPFRFDRNKMHLGNFSYQGIARLKPGVTLAEASADVARMIPITIRSFQAPEGYSIKLFEQAGFAPNLRPLKQDVIGDVGKVLWVLMGSIGIVLLIACANVANLFLVRVEGRRQELAIRSALGAGRWRIAGELLFETVILGLLGCALGLELADAALRPLISLAPTGLPRINEIHMDARVFLFTLAVSLFASLLIGLIPIFKYAGTRLNAGLREGARGMSQSRSQHRARNSLVVVQVALAAVLLICSGLMIRTFRALTNVNPGFDTSARFQTFRIYISPADVKEGDADRVIHMEEEISRRLAAIPGVSSVGISTKIPMDENGNFDLLFAEDHHYAEGELPPVRHFKYIGPGFLSTMGMPLVFGRDITWSDVYERLPVALISENFAREYWGDPQKALGKRIRAASTDDWREIIGVVANVYDDGISKDPSSAGYFPIMTKNFDGDTGEGGIDARRGVAFAIRTPRAGSENFLKDVRQAVWSVDSNLPLAAVHTEDYYYKQSMARTSFTLIMLGVAGGMALLLGTIGIYGVIAYSVSQRTREIGIRMALGAQPQTVTGIFVRQGLLLSGIGVACGVGAALGVMRLMTSLLFHVSPVDPITYFAVCVGLAATAALASYVPSRQAASVDPVEALRAE